MTSPLPARSPATALTDQQVYRLLLAATFLVFLVSVVVRRVVRAVGGGPSLPARSILAEARETSSSTLLIAFAG